MMNDRTVLIVIGILIVLLMGSILYVTHLPMTPQNRSTQTASTTATSTVATTTTTQKTTKPTGSKVPTGTVSKPGTPAAAPYIEKFLPAGGSPGTTVTIVGSGFSKTGNHIYFGSSTGRYHADGTPANQIATVGSTDGTTLTFTVPSSGPSGILCDTSGCIAVSARAIVPGEYPVSVSNSAGTSNSVSYDVISQ